MNLTRLKEMIDWIATAPVHELDLREGDLRIRLVKFFPSHGAEDPAPMPAGSKASDPDAGPAAVAVTTINAPMFGTFHLRPDTDSAPFIEPGQRVRTGDQIGLIEAMKVFNALEADRDGTIAEILVSDASEVAAGDPLMRIEP